MGFGLDAHSMLLDGDGAVRFANADELKSYGAASWGGDVVRVGVDEAFEESVFLGLRLNEGLDVSALRELFGKARMDVCGEAVEEMVEGGMMEAHGGRWFLTLRGRVVSSEVFGRLLAGVGAL